jgi:hypothetical protein
MLAEKVSTCFLSTLQHCIMKLLDDFMIIILMVFDATPKVSTASQESVNVIDMNNNALLISKILPFRKILI